MKRIASITLCAAAAFIASAMFVGCQTARAEPPNEQQAAGLNPDTSVMIVPVVVGERPWRNASDVVGMMLEQEGMPNIQTCDTEFKPADGADLSQVAAAFGEWAAGQKFKEACVLFAQFSGSPDAGVAEVRGVLVDSAGKILWSDRQTPDDADFKRLKPREPMTCCQLLTERLKPQFRLTGETRGRVKDGRMARRGREESTLPPKEELKAMEGRIETLKKAISGAELRVYPVQLLEGTSVEYAKDLAEKLEKSVAAAATVDDAALNIEITPSPNEQRRLWELARKFRDHVRAEKADADYAMVAEYVIRPTNQEVWTVHFVICDRAGEWVVVDFQNNHHDDFNAVNPKSPEDCASLVLRRLKHHLE